MIRGSIYNPKRSFTDPKCTRECGAKVTRVIVDASPARRHCACNFLPPGKYSWLGPVSFVGQWVGREKLPVTINCLTTLSAPHTHTQTQSATHVCVCVWSAFECTSDRYAGPELRNSFAITPSMLSNRRRQRLTSSSDGIYGGRGRTR